MFKNDDIVPQDGWYICVPCGYVDEFKAGDKFPICPVCLAGTDDGPDGSTDPHADYWDFFN
jgi:hypothetical protein